MITPNTETKHPFFEVLQSNIIDWADTRHIFVASNPLKQLEKSQEELTETRDAVVEYQLKLNHIDLFDPEISLDKIRDGIGDTVVTLTILAKMFDMTIEECTAYAYEQIKNRKGVIKDGVFVREK